MVTTTTPRLARLAPSYCGCEPEPVIKDPPWMKTITGAGTVGVNDGVQTLRYRQSSLIAERGIPKSCVSGCMHTAPDFVASRTPVHPAAAFGSRQRKSPTGGAA